MFTHICMYAHVYIYRDMYVYVLMGVRGGSVTGPRGEEHVPHEAGAGRCPRQRQDEQGPFLACR